MNSTYSKLYKRFIFMNSSIRGPFMPSYSSECWSDVFSARFTDKVKMSGLTYNCYDKVDHHIQGMMFATDDVGFEIMKPTMKCFNDFWGAVLQSEIKLSNQILNKGYDIYVTQASAWEEGSYFQNCTTNDLWSDNFYYGGNLNPYELIFFKSNRKLNEVALQMATDFTIHSNYSSYDYCKPKELV
eukprot:TRINITY_DN1502_c1_g1_i5.p1 TRINITY_DN1502_c1_g1~~TRINITY_DN1502_c1_g1_i5.p1  ORF type:complete len:185 (-),score=16.71 TRINITY_DN1502_c1_g1_i5:96-650(-)